MMLNTILNRLLKNASTERIEMYAMVTAVAGAAILLALVCYSSVYLALWVTGG